MLKKSQISLLCVIYFNAFGFIYASLPDQQSQISGILFWSKGNNAYNTSDITEAYEQFKHVLHCKNYQFTELFSSTFSDVEEKMPTCPSEEVVSESEVYEFPLHSEITQTQPFTGIVLWSSNPNNSDSMLQLEYSYIKFEDVATARKPSRWNWSRVESLLNLIASRGHQAILRPYAVWPGQPTTIPRWLKDSNGYTETREQVEGVLTWLEDWSSVQLETLYLEFYRELALRYDRDPRVAYLQVGFGSYAEYHLYGGQRRFGGNFPSVHFQNTLLTQLERDFKHLRWQMSIDAIFNGNAGELWQRFPSIATLQHGCFDDSLFLHGHKNYNMDRWNDFNYTQRNLVNPAGGEIGFRAEKEDDPLYDPSVRNRWIQEWQALLPEGVHGETFEATAQRLLLSFVIGSWMPQYHGMHRIREASRSMGYKFRVLNFIHYEMVTRVTVENFGYLPIAYDAYISVNGIRSKESLSFLFPQQTKVYMIESGIISRNVTLSIECDRLVSGQKIEFEAHIIAKIAS